jgi:hypothetical protein
MTGAHSRLGNESHIARTLFCDLEPELTELPDRLGLLLFRNLSSRFSSFIETDSDRLFPACDLLATPRLQGASFMLFHHFMDLALSFCTVAGSLFRHNFSRRYASNVAVRAIPAPLRSFPELIRPTDRFAVRPAPRSHRPGGCKRV